MHACMQIFWVRSLKEKATPRKPPREAHPEPVALGEFFFQALGLEFRVKGLGFSVQAFRRGVVEQSIFVTAYGKH